MYCISRYKHDTPNGVLLNPLNHTHVFRCRRLHHVLFVLWLCTNS